MVSIVERTQSSSGRFAIVACVLLVAVREGDHLGFPGFFRAVVACWKLVVLFGLAAAYTVIVVASAARLELWHETALKETVFWFFGVGLVLMGSAIVASRGDGYVNKAIAQALRVTVLIEFIANVYVFPLAVELLLIPIVVALVVAASRPELTPLAKGVVNGALMTIGFMVIGFFGVKAISDPGSLLTRENAEDLLVVPVMTLAFIPFLYGIARYSEWEQANLPRQFLASDPEPSSERSV